MILTFTCPGCGSALEADATLTGTMSRCPGCDVEVEVPHAEVRPGVTISGIRIDGLLGRGGMGEVFLATHLAMDRRVALKILPSSMTGDAQFVQRFMNEVRVAGRLDHPNIVTAYDAGEDHGVYYFAMAYVDGLSLDLYLRRDGAFAEKKALDIGLKVARALDYAWQRFHMLHRDVKPANIMLDKAGEPKLTDMGLAKMSLGKGGLTGTNSAMGTPHYMSPEQIRAALDLDFRADMYSLGASLYHLLTGSQPFPGNTAAEVMARHLNDPLVPPREVNPRLSPGCDLLVRVMMAKEPKDRYASWELCIRDLEAAVRGEVPPVAFRKLGHETVRKEPAECVSSSGKRIPPVLVQPRKSAAARAKVVRIVVLVLAICVFLGLVLGAVFGIFFFSRGAGAKRLDGNSAPVEIVEPAGTAPASPGLPAPGD